MPSRPTVTDDDYARLLAFRTGLRTFLKRSRDAGAQAGLPPSQHQLLLAIRGHQGSPPTIGDVAEYLLVKPHSAGELVSRAEAAGLVQRVRGQDDRRIVHLKLTAKGSRKLAALTEATLEELRRLGPRLRKVWSGLDIQP